MPGEDFSCAFPARASKSFLPFYVGRTHPIFASWRRIQTIPKSPPKPRNPRRIVPMCSRSGRRWRNCSIPRSTAAMPVWVPAPDCSRRRKIRKTAAPAARPRCIARGRRRAAPATMWRSGMLPSPRPLRQRAAVSTKRRRPITAHQPPFRRSIRNWQSSSASLPRRKTSPRWRGRRATRWRRSASPPPRTRWKA